MSVATAIDRATSGSARRTPKEIQSADESVSLVGSDSPEPSESPALTADGAVPPECAEVFFILPDTSTKLVSISADWNADQVFVAVETALGINPSDYWFITPPHGGYTRPRGNELLSSRIVRLVGKVRGPKSIEVEVRSGVGSTRPRKSASLVIDPLWDRAKIATELEKVLGTSVDCFYFHDAGGRFVARDGSLLEDVSFHSARPYVLVLTPKSSSRATRC